MSRARRFYPCLDERKFRASLARGSRLAAVDTAGPQSLERAPRKLDLVRCCRSPQKSCIAPLRMGLWMWLTVPVGARADEMVRGEIATLDDQFDI